MRRSLVVLPAAAFLLASLSVAAPADAAAPHIPGSITAVTAQPGPGVGEITLKWTQDGSYTTSYVLETGLSSFSKTDPDMAKSGRNAKLTTISDKVRTVTLTAAQVAALGAPVASGNHVYFRFSAINKDSTGASTPRNYPYLQAVLPKPQSPAVSGGKLRVASFNVRTARATTDSRTWLQRAPDVATEIVHYNAGVVAIQELGPGRADGQTGTTNGTPRQTDSLQTALDKVGGTKYDLVRTTPYVPPSQVSGTQGARILYDTTKYTLRSSCSDVTGKSSYSSSCSIQLPLISGDNENLRRRAAFAEFEDKATRSRFFFVSVHLDDRHDDDTASTEARYDGLRKNQVDTITTAINALNTHGEPVIIGGDFNSWQNNYVNNSPHDTLISQGYYDTSAAVTRTNFQYSTISHFDTTMKAAAQGVGTRIDMILVKGARGASRFDNVMQVTDSSRPSDHNLIGADIAPLNPWKSAAVVVRPSHRQR